VSIENATSRFIVILDDKHSFLAALDLAGGSGDQSVLVGHLSRKAELDCRAGAHLAVDFDVSARLLKEAVNHREAEPRALVFSFGCKERFVDPLQNVWGNAGAGISHGDHHILPSCQFIMLSDVHLVEEGIAGLDCQSALAVHPIPGVDREIQNRILELIRVDQAIPKTTGDYRLDLDLPAEGPTQHL
jgi:hypothetical protein